ncbi:MAG: FHA domain-containing protein [Lentisphaerae bacterium]|nr:FHA domain-containing protein [Lentisphaerota bacterium]OQC12279.1 MAG: ABC transporter ATP-binding/permease protein [Lentisphaerae bacterium ADurb.Bin082]HQL86331.1 FHA domain-containing protein [Lentisphaeria bacterium]
MGLKPKKELQVRLEYDGKVLYEATVSEIDSEITIGRSPESAWRIPATDRSASSNHAAVVKRRGKLVVVDRGSRNGIYFQGAKVPEHRLAAGDQVGVGECRIYADWPAASAIRGPEREFNQLEQLNGEKKGAIYKLDKQNVRIGSAADCDIVLNDSVVSQFHAAIEQKADGGCWIRDLGSRNATKVNGAALSGAANDSGRLLKDGDVITISYIELKFWDKYAVHVRSHLFLKTVTVILTLAVLLGGYYAWLSVMPSAKANIDRARDCARRCNFAAARTHLANAANARQAERYRAERTELAAQIDQWEDTVQKWSEVKQLLADKKWISANKVLSPMLSQNMEMWRWNDTDANEAKNEALAAKRVIDAYLEGRGTLEEANSSLEQLERSAEALAVELKTLARKPPDFCRALIAFSVDIRDELTWTTSRLRDIESRLQGLDALEKLEPVIAGIEAIREEAEQHGGERQKKALRYSPKPARMASDVLEPLYKLRRAKNTLDGNYAAVAALDFGKINKELPLPTVEECAVYPVMADKRLQIVMLSQQLEDDAMQLERIWNTFRKFSLEPGKIPACLESLADNKRLEAVLACDCLQKPLPKWTRTEPTSEYDRILGVEAFYDFLSQLPSAFDASILEERPFLPEIYQVRTLYSYLEMLLTFLAKDTLTMVKQQKQNNKVMELALHADDLLLQRDALVQKLLALTNKSEQRDGVIAGAMAMLIGKASALPADLGEELQTKCRRIRQKIMAMQEKEQTPEQIIITRRKIIEVGFPGDSLVKQAWATEYPAQ